MADTRTLARHSRRVLRPTADMSPGKAEERILKYPPPRFNQAEVSRKSAEEIFQFGANAFGFALFGLLQKTSSAETKE